MRCLSTVEQKEWLIKNDQVEEPYSQTAHSNGKFYQQFYAPLRLAQINAFTESFLDSWKLGDALLVITDWSLYHPYEMKLIEHLRSAHGEKRPLIEAPGHLFSLEEKHDLVSIFSLSTAYYWSAYLYLPFAKTTLFNWEGEIFDFWTDDSEKQESLLGLRKKFKLKRTGLLSTKFYWMGKKTMWRCNRLIKVRRS